MYCVWYLHVYSWSDRLAPAVKLKQDGNVRYRSGNYSGAIQKYQLALDYLHELQELHEDQLQGAPASDVIEQPTNQQLDQINSLTVDCRNNLAGQSAAPHISLFLYIHVHVPFYRAPCSIV